MAMNTKHAQSSYPSLSMSYALAAACVVLDLYLVIRHRNKLTYQELLFLCLPLGVQFCSQWWRLLQYQKSLSVMNSPAVSNSSELNEERRIAATTQKMLAQVVFSSFLIELLLLLYVGYALGF